MKYAATLLALGIALAAAPAEAQEVIVAAPEVVTTYYAPSVPVTTYYAPAVTTYYAPAPVTTYYYSTYAAPAVAYYPATTYYVPPRVARRWYRSAYYPW